MFIATSGEVSDPNCAVDATVNTRRPARWSPRVWVILAVVLAALLKLYCAATTFGSCDVTIHARFGQIVDAAGIDYMYRLERHFNHPPVTGEFFGLAYHLAAWLTPPAPHAVPGSFPFLLRLPSILADILAVLVLLKFQAKTGRPPTWAIVLFALSPAAFMVSGFHGNVDQVMVCVLLVATYFCVAEHVWLSAIFLALACAIKIIPLFLAPVFFFFWLHRGVKPALRFSVTFGLGCLAVWSGALLGSAGYFARNVLGYSSFAGGWGITYWCVHLLDAFHYEITPELLNHLSPLLVGLKLVVAGSVMALGWMRRKAAGLGFAESVALAWICFAVFAPGFIPYYTIWFAPFLLLYSPACYAVFTAASSIYLFAYYHMMSQGFPWNASDPSAPPAWNDWGVIPWSVALAIGLWALTYGRRPRVAIVPACAPA